MNELAAFIAASIVVEALISYANIIVKKRVKWKMIFAIIIGCILAVDLRLDIFSMLEIDEMNSIIGTLMTGVIISRGSNYVYDLYDRLTNWKRPESVK